MSLFPTQTHSSILRSESVGPLYLKHRALDKEWDTSASRRTLRVDANTTKEIASELQLMGYSVSVLRRSGSWRNTASGNVISGVRPPRLSRAKAEELLTDLADRAEAYNLKAATVHIVKIVAFRATNGIDLGVRVEPRGEGPVSKYDGDAAFRELRGRSITLNLHPLVVLNAMKDELFGRRK
jgi:hypothetical protein